MFLRTAISGLSQNYQMNLATEFEELKAKNAIPEAETKELNELFLSLDRD